MDSSLLGVQGIGVDASPEAGILARHRELVFAAVLAVALSGTLFLFERRIDFYIGEEGFLWYGAVQTAHGAVPLRDFYAYDPGRYVWAAAFARVFGDGLLALRLSMAVFQTLGLFCGILAAGRALGSRSQESQRSQRSPRSQRSQHWLLALTGVLLLLWQVPRNKLFEPSLLLMAVWIGVLLLEAPTLRRHAAAGAFVGLAAFFGKNHGLYLLLAFGLLILYQWAAGERSDVRELARRILAWGGGIALGLAPLWILLAAAPGFFTAYLDSIRFFLAQGQTNFPLPVPWPWRAAQNARLFADEAFRFALGVGFLLMPLLYGTAAVTGLMSRGAAVRQRALLISCGFLGLPYMHHAFSRADLHHLMPASPPLLLAIVALLSGLPAGRRRLRRAALVTAVTVLAPLTFLLAVRPRPLYAEIAGRGTADALVPCDVAGDRLWLNPHQAALLRHVQRTVAGRVPPGEPLLIVPDQPGLYPVLGRRSPVWDVYAIWPDRGGLDDRMLREIQRSNVRWVMLRDFPLDGRDDLRFSRTRPRVWRYLRENFQRISTRTVTLPREIALLRRVESPGAPAGASYTSSAPSGTPPQASQGQIWRRKS